MKEANISIPDFARSHGYSEEQVKAACTDLELYRRAPNVKTARLDNEKQRKISEHLKEKVKPVVIKQTKNPARKIGNIQITERPRRERKPRPILRSSPAAAAETPPAKPPVAVAVAVVAAKKQADAPVEKAATKTPAQKEEKAAAETAAAKEGKTVTGPLNPEQLLFMQIKKQEEKAEEQKKQAEQKKSAAVEKNVKVKPSPPPSPTGKIKIDPKFIKKRNEKRKRNINRSAVRQQMIDKQHTFQKPTKPVVRDIKISDAVSVSRLAADMSLKSGVIIRKLMDHDINVTVNELLDKETAWIIVEELGHKPVEAVNEDLEKDLVPAADIAVPSLPRAPVVTVMGHVDHGKTSLLDYIRRTRVAPGEAGGITQHIGAYQVESAIGWVTFIDTPGHALFTKMRARGAEVTDIVVLVVAADDGVKPQTVEAINHAKAAKVPIVVAANKMDKPEADLEKVKRELANHDVLPEDWGGDAIVVPVSAETGAGVDKLLDALATQTDILELKAPVESAAAGVVIEAKVDKGRGIVATLVITRGTLRRGDSFLCGAESGRVRAMWNASSPQLAEATPSTPVEIQGLSGVPEAGAELLVVEDERKAREIASARQTTNRAKGILRTLSVGGDEQSLLDEEEWKELKIVVKADVEGSREALVAALNGISGKKAGVKVVHSAVGNVTESDIYLAQTSGDVIVAFNVRPNNKARILAESRGVKILIGNVIYELMEKVSAAVLDLLEPIVEEKFIGAAEVLRVFSITKVGNIAGCRVTDGVVRAAAAVRLLRDGVPVYEGRIASLRHFKDMAAEVRAGSECGIDIEKFNDIKAGDTIEVIEHIQIAPEM